MAAKKASKEESKKGETSKDEKGNKKDEKKEVELSDEDLALKESLSYVSLAARIPKRELRSSRWRR